MHLVLALLEKILSKRTDVQLLFYPAFSARTERPKDWVPEEVASCKQGNSVSDEQSDILEVAHSERKAIVDIFSIHLREGKQLLIAVYLETIGLQ